MQHRLASYNLAGGLSGNDNDDFQEIFTLTPTCSSEPAPYTPREVPSSKHLDLAKPTLIEPQSPSPAAMHPEYSATEETALTTPPVSEDTGQPCFTASCLSRDVAAYFDNDCFVGEA